MSGPKSSNQRNESSSGTNEESYLLDNLFDNHVRSCCIDLEGDCIRSEIQNEDGKFVFYE